MSRDFFVVEGVRMAAELPKDQVKSIYVSETFAKNPENAAILAEYPGYELVSDSVFAVMSDTQTPRVCWHLSDSFPTEWTSS